jgi:hypothetical protein
MMGLVTLLCAKHRSAFYFLDHEMGSSRSGNEVTGVYPNSSLMGIVAMWLIDFLFPFLLYCGMHCCVSHTLSVTQYLLFIPFLVTVGPVAQLV